jgi:hypothetical protein
MSQDSDRITEMTTRAASYNTEQATVSDVQGKNDCAVAAQYCLDEKRRLSGLANFTSPPK